MRCMILWPDEEYGTIIWVVAEAPSVDVSLYVQYEANLKLTSLVLEDLGVRHEPRSILQVTPKDMGLIQGLK